MLQLTDVLRLRFKVEDLALNIKLDLIIIQLGKREKIFLFSSLCCVLCLNEKPSIIYDGIDFL